MDARERLRAYLEQRRELGESEFVLDGMSVDDALSAIDKLRPATPARSATRQPSRPAQAAPAQPRAHHIVRETEQRAESPAIRAQPAEVVPVVRAESGAVGGASSAAEGDEDESEDIARKSAVQGLIVGTSTGTLFEQNPYHSTDSLASLAGLIQECTRCPLYKTAKNAVPGDGDPEADFMCVGEAPGANEDETGHPFVGQAGALLTKILAAIDLTREQVFITNVLKHRPPGNRNPAPDEVEACSPYLVRQIQMVKPKVILALGTFAAQTLLQTKTPIGKLRGAVHRYYGIPLIVTYHPAALLRNPAWKRPTWEDVKLARHVLDTSKS